MTLQEISQYMKLRERLERDEEILESLRAAACPGAQVLTGMPHAPGIRDKVGDLAVEISDMEERIRFLQKEIAQEKKSIEVFINTVQDERLRMIFRLRFLRCLTWQATADILGWAYSEDSVKRLCYRYLESTQ